LPLIDKHSKDLDQIGCKFNCERPQFLIQTTKLVVFLKGSRNSKTSYKVGYKNDMKKKLFYLINYDALRPFKYFTHVQVCCLRYPPPQYSFVADLKEKFVPANLIRLP